jgi:hypothetical protein
MNEGDDDECVGPMFDERFEVQGAAEDSNGRSKSGAQNAMTYRVAIDGASNETTSAAKDDAAARGSTIGWMGPRSNACEYCGGGMSKKRLLLMEIGRLERRVSHLEEKREWVPGTLARAMVLSLGYGIGEDVCDSPNGLYVAISLFLLGVTNEFIHGFVREACMKVESRKRSYGTMQKVFILIRHFAATAIAYAAGEILLRRTFGGDGNVPTVIIMLIIVFSVADISDLFSVISFKQHVSHVVPKR